MQGSFVDEHSISPRFCPGFSPAFSVSSGMPVVFNLSAVGTFDEALDLSLNGISLGSPGRGIVKNLEITRTGARVR